MGLASGKRLGSNQFKRKEEEMECEKFPIPSLGRTTNLVVGRVGKRQGQGMDKLPEKFPEVVGLTPFRFRGGWGDFLPHVFGYMGGERPTKLTKPPRDFMDMGGKPTDKTDNPPVILLT